MITPDSTSYPYLALAQQRGLAYADVLKFSDLLDDDSGAIPERNQIDAAQRLGPTARRAVIVTWEAENRRRSREMEAARASP